MDTNMQESVPILVSYLNSLADINPSWSCQNDAHQKYHSNTFSNLLGHEYSTTKNLEIQRSNNIEKPLFHEISNPTAHGSLKIEYSPTFGRYLVASRDIDAGDVVFREKPLVLAPKAGTGPTCLRCLKFLEDAWEVVTGVELPCARQLARVVGILLTNARSSPDWDSETARTCLSLKCSTCCTPLRTLLLLKNNPAAAEVVAALQSNKEVRRKLQIGHYIEEHVVGTLQKRLNLDVKSDVVHHICGVFDTNAFEVSVDDSRRGRALFPLGAIMNHSCLPNTQHWFRDGVLIVRAVTDIAAGESITNTYTPMLLGTRGRAAHLAATKLFRCACKRCLDPTELGSHVSSVLCRSCSRSDRSFVVPPDGALKDWQCLECQNRMPDVAVETMMRAANSTRSRVPLHDLEALRVTSDHLRMMLGKRHYITLEVRYALMNAIMRQPLRDIKDDDLDIAVEISGDLLEIASIIDPGFSRFRGLVLLARIRASTEKLKRSCDNAPLCNGTSHKSELGRVMQEDEEEEEDKELTEMDDATPRQKAQMLLREAAECEFILQYDPKMEEALATTNQLRSFLNDS
ncbi:LOW QUALITY PROTEIN: SET domain-containing protein SmydA-8-like [Macrobrachium rosenbergii]|uniref:LOW QUALITY PROTEIN: SET domain-containing protein SmydA-8-like n=1 Tax=Macrobrachium rosenbergii TaxID=79674 RepID=UPI0034D6ED65